ncbi:MAG: DUF1549 and DUF1553 domain-containing protein [Planctomycetota bacterium]
MLRHPQTSSGFRVAIRGIGNRLLSGLLLAATMVAPRAAAQDNPKATQFAAPVDHIDALLRESWREDAIEPAGRSDDAEFCRRIWLDLAGVAPPVWQLRAFLADESVDKRSRLVDELLRSPRFAIHMANRWTESLLPANTTAIPTEQGRALNQWLRDQFLVNKPYDHLIGGFLTAGNSSDQGPAIFYTSREADPVKLAAATSRLFMGIQLECAQCHDHPFSTWTQDDFWSFAAFYSQVELDENAAMQARPAIRDRRGKEVNFPETDRVMPPRYPGVAAEPEPDPTDFRRRQLTIWLASRDNPYFARAAVNRAWSHLFGRGLVDPVDDMDLDNPPSHPEVLDYLTEYLIETRFDLRELYRVLASTEAYSLSSRYARALDQPRPPLDTFAVMSVKTLSPEQFYDTLMQNIFLSKQPNQVMGQDPLRASFLTRMRSTEATSVDYPHGVVQSLGLMNGPEMRQAISPQASGLIQSFDAPFLSNTERVETLFLACLSRLPSDEEAAMFGELLGESDDVAAQKNRLSDLTWVLLNTAECFVCP